MKNKIFYSLLRTMFFNVKFFQIKIPRILLGNRCFKASFETDDEVNIIIRNFDNYSNKQMLCFNTELMRIDSITQYSEKESDMHLVNFMHRTVFPRKAYSDFKTRRMFNQFNLYIQYIILSFNYIYWR